MMNQISLPIDSALEQICEAVRQQACVIVEAPPGAGKTTRVAPAVLNRGSLTSGRIVLVQPRRIAARTAAARIAMEMGVQLGQQVGYQVRFDHQVSSATRIAVMTPGVLIRQIQQDPTLAGISVVILDEFHERSLEYDLLLGMVRRLQVAARPEMRLVIMSATLNTVAISEYLDQPPVIRVDGHMYPVSIRYARAGRSKNIVESVTEVIPEATQNSEGDVLVFLPGVGEILQVARNIEPTAQRRQWSVLPLYGDLASDEQDRVLAPSQFRKIILATNVAETSLTIDGVRVVIDSGWARMQRVDATVGLNILALEPISRASADQRAGRAGRTAPGICWRLWDEITHRSRPVHTDPEILRVDLAGAVLQLITWGESPESFPWITPPRSQAIDQALELLERLGALQHGRATQLGQLLLRLPVHPRLARLLVEGHRLGIGQTAALAAAMLSERDVFDRRQVSSDARHVPPTQSVVRCDCDVTQRVTAIQDFFNRGTLDYPMGTIRRGAAFQVQRVATQLLDQLYRELGTTEENDVDDYLQRSLLAAFPDRLAKRREPQKPRGLMVGGRGVRLDNRSGVLASELFLCIDVDAAGSEATVRQASAIDPLWLDLKHLRETDERFIHPTQGTVVTRRRTYWLDLVIEETPVTTPLDEHTAEILAKHASSNWSKVFPVDNKTLTSLIGRVRWLAAALPDAALPDMSETGLQSQLSQWCWGLKSLAELRSLPWLDLVRARLTSSQLQLLEREAPESYTLPSGRRVVLQYEAGKPPILSARIQDFFGLSDTPRLAQGRVSLLLHLLAPNNRCQQITEDLASFWKNTYPTVRKELRGRYPKHAWPENPLKAIEHQR